MDRFKSRLMASEEGMSNIQQKNVERKYGTMKGMAGRTTREYNRISEMESKNGEQTRTE